MYLVYNLVYKAQQKACSPKPPIIVTVTNKFGKNVKR